MKDIIFIIGVLQEFSQGHFYHPFLFHFLFLSCLSSISSSLSVCPSCGNRIGSRARTVPSDPQITDVKTQIQKKMK